MYEYAIAILFIILDANVRCWSLNTTGEYNKNLLRYGFHKTHDCQDFPKAFVCVKKCLESGYDVAYSDKECKCTCYHKKEKGKYKYSENTTDWKLGAPTTTLPGWVAKMKGIEPKDAAAPDEVVIGDITTDATGSKVDDGNSGNDKEGEDPPGSVDTTTAAGDGGQGGEGGEGGGGGGGGEAGEGGEGGPEGEGGEGGPEGEGGEGEGGGEAGEAGDGGEGGEGEAGVDGGRAGDVTKINAGRNLHTTKNPKKEKTVTDKEGSGFFDWMNTLIPRAHNETGTNDTDVTDVTEPGAKGGGSA